MTAPTDRIHLRDSLCLEFDARALGAGSVGGRPTLILDRTAFYAEGGGQLGDRGVLEVDGRRVDVVDTQVDGAVVHHLLAEAVDAAGATVVGRVDADRRRRQMAEHTAQHMLSEALVRWASANTSSSRLGERSTTLDLDRLDVPADALAECEERVNDLVRDDLPVRVHFPSAAELAGMSLRSRPKVTHGVRVVEVDGFDWTPCGGTHCTSTAQVGLVRITGTEKWGGGLRIRFVAGRNALDDYRVKDDVLGGLAARFTCGVTDVPAAIGKLSAGLKETQQALGATRKELVGLVADAALSAHAPSGAATPILLVRPADDATTIRALAARLSERPDVVAFVICRAGDGWLFAARHGDGVQVDLGGFVRSLKDLGARGGGRPPTAQGRFAGDVDWDTVRTALAAACS